MTGFATEVRSLEAITQDRRISAAGAALGCRSLAVCARLCLRVWWSLHCGGGGCEECLLEKKSSGVMVVVVDIGWENCFRIEGSMISRIVSVQLSCK